jgi:hypothetical protein
VLLRVDSAVDLVPRALEFYLLHGLFLAFVEVQLEHSVFGMRVLEDLCDCGIFGDGSSFFFEGDVDIVVVYFV